MRWFVISAVAIAAFAASVVLFGPFRYSAVCNRCGAIQRTTEWQIPRTSIRLISRSSIQQTPVSLCLTTNRIVTSHDHQWIFAQGGGNGVRCALGGAHRVRSTVESSEVAQLLEALDRHGEHGFRDKVLTNLFDDSSTIFVHSLSVPTGGFTNASQLRAWISEEAQYFDEMVSASKGR